MTPRKLSCCLTFDFDGLAGFVRGQRDLTSVSRGEFGAAVGLPRVLDLLRAHDVRATFFATGDAALCYPSLIERMCSDGHEVAHHGWAHEIPAELDRDEEILSLERGTRALEAVTGVRPRGYRAPGWAMSFNTIDLLVEQGFAYDSSLMASDVRPYYLRNGDRWSGDGPPQFGTPCHLPEVPVYWGLDDAVLFEFTMGKMSRQAFSSDVEQSWKEEFDYAWEHCPGGVFTLTMHPHVIGRGARILMLERLIEYYRARQGVMFETVIDAVEGWQADNPLEAWVRDNPLFASPGSASLRPTEGD